MANYDHTTPNLTLENAPQTSNAPTTLNHINQGILHSPTTGNITNNTYRMKRKKFMSLTSAAVTLKSKLLKLSLTKLGQITDPEVKLRRCVLIYNAAKALKREIVALEEKRNAAFNSPPPPPGSGGSGKRSQSLSYIPTTTSTSKEEGDDTLVRNASVNSVSEISTQRLLPPSLSKDQYRYSSNNVPSYPFYPHNRSDNYETLEDAHSSYSVGASKNALAAPTSSYSMMDFPKYSQHYPTPSSPPIIANSSLESLKLFDF